MEAFTDDLTIPAETPVYSSNGNFQIIMPALLVLAGLYDLINQHYLFGVIFAGSGSYLFYKYYNQFKTKNVDQSDPKEAHIILSDKGIFTKDAQFHQWSDISNEEVIRETGTYKPTTYFLAFDYYPGNYEKFKITGLAITPKKLRHLLYIYRGRSAKR